MRHRFVFQRRYCGGVQAVLFDWAGTVVDYGSRAPAGVFVEVYRRHGVDLSLDEARQPMGLEKRDHIAALAALPGVAARWQAANGSPLGEADIDRMYDEFLPLQLACLAQHADLVPGTLGLIAACRERGIKIGSSTGYARVLMNVLAKEAAERGFEPDAIVCADEVPEGRPAPWMCLANAQQLGVYPMEAIVVVDDTAPGIEAGLSAGMWSVGVALSGNEMGLSRAEVDALSPDDRKHRLDRARQRLYRSGAHYVIDTVADLLPVLNAIEHRMQCGERP